MNIKIVNCPDRNFKPFIERAAKYFCEELIPNKRIRNNCYTVIIFNDKITEFGSAEIVAYNTLKKAREFKIEIHPGIGVRNIFETLAHEMVHVRQLAKGQMKFLPDQARVWMGKRYSKKTHYLDQPWELDAFARQEIVFRKAIEL